MDQNSPKKIQQESHSVEEIFLLPSALSLTTDVYKQTEEPKSVLHSFNFEEKAEKCDQTLNNSDLSKSITPAQVADKLNFLELEIKKLRTILEHQNQTSLEILENLSRKIEDLNTQKY
jgi:hypothetical protein